MENLGEQEENLNIVEELEIQYYEVQLELYNVQLEVLKHEEMLLIVQLDTIKRQIKGETKILFKHIFRTQKWHSLLCSQFKKKKGYHCLGLASESIAGKH